MGAGAVGDRFFYLALGFNGAVNRWAGIVTTKTASGNQAHTEPGFKPQFVLHLCSPAALIDETLTADADGAGSFGIGVFTAFEAFTTIVTDSAGSATMNTQSYVQSRPGVSRKGSQANTFALTFVSMDIPGWTVNYSAADATPRKWPTYVIGEFPRPHRVALIEDDLEVHPPKAVAV